MGEFGWVGGWVGRGLSGLLFVLERGEGGDLVEGGRELHLEVMRKKEKGEERRGGEGGS